MKKFKVILFLTVMLLLAALPFLSSSAASVVKNIDDLLITVTADRFDGTTPVTVAADISTLTREALGEYGGTISVTIETNAPNEAGVEYSIDITNNGNITSANSIIKVTVTFTVQDKTKLTDFQITSAILTATPEEVLVSPTPDSSDAASPTGSIEPTPDGETPTIEPSPTATDVIMEPTTQRPQVTPEPTKDTYVSNSQTQAPPTLSLPPEVTIDPNELSTPVPEATLPPLEKVSNSPSLSFWVLLLVLVLLLAVDIFLIYWRKQMGYGVLINNGVSRRKVRDDLVDYPENAETSDLEEAIKEETPME